MVWFFAAVVLLLLVYNRGFRRFMLWAGGVAALVSALAIGGFAYSDYKPRDWLDAGSTVVPDAQSFDPSTAVPADGPPIDPSKVQWDAPGSGSSPLMPVLSALVAAAGIWLFVWYKRPPKVGSLAWARSRIRKL